MTVSSAANTLASRVCAALPEARRWVVAYSGGLDSHVLLHALAQAKPAAALHALHVHHGLHPHADAWATHCERVCAALGIACEVLPIDCSDHAGMGLEAWARQQRYDALQRRLKAGDCLLTAHHQDDQAETVLLQLLRGAGPKGLAAMPAVATLGSALHARPLLAVGREELRDYACAHALHWIEDPSNADSHWPRNFLRARVMPLLRQRWPAAAPALARSAGWMAEADQLCFALARADLEAVQGEAPDRLSLAGLRRLDAARQRNVLRHWFARRGLPPPQSRHLDQILGHLLGERPHAGGRVHWPGANVCRYGEELFAMGEWPAHDPQCVLDWNLHQTLDLPGLSQCLVARTVHGRGLRREDMHQRSISVRFRQGGERCRPSGSPHHRTLKNLLQEWRVPPWLRSRIPLIYVDDQLAAVVGYACCEPWCAGENEAGVWMEVRHAQ